MDKDRFRDFISIAIDEEVLRRFQQTPDGAILGRDFLERNRDKYPWEVGGTYQLAELGGVSLTFVGTFTSDNPVYNTVILADRRYLQEVDGRLGQVHQVLIKLSNPAYSQTLAAALDQQIPTRFPYETTTVDQRAFLTAALEEMAEIVRFSRLIMAITLAVILAAVANTISMATRDRVQEVGTLRALGFRRAHILWMVQGESLLLALAGGALGVFTVFGLLRWGHLLLGLFGLEVPEGFSSHGYTVPIEMRPEVAAIALGLSLLVGLLGGLLPAIGASRLQIVQALRRVE